MKFRFSAFLLLFLTLISRFAFSQVTTANGFIVTNSGDSISGKLEYVNTNLSAKRLFIPAGTTELQTIMPETVSSFKINDEVNFKTLPFKGKKVFMKVVSEGQLNLYNYKGGLFTRMPNDSLIQLTGGKKLEMKDEKKYALVDFTYKKQLRQALNSDKFDGRLNNLEFDNEQISNLAREINGQMQLATEPKLKNNSQFELSLSYTRNAVTLKNIDFREDTISFGETFEEETDFKYLPGEKQNLKGIGLGLFYKLKVGRKYSYLKAGVVYNHVFEVQKTQHYSFYAWRHVEHPSTAQFMYNGSSLDTYTYKLSTIEIPVSYHADLADGRNRPFIELGLVSKLYGLASVKLKREIATAEGETRVQNDAMKLPPVTIGPMIAVGYKYLVSPDTAIMAGINANATTSFEHRPSHNLHRNSNLNLFLSYGF